MIRSALALAMMVSPAYAEAFDRPLPQAQSATAEVLFGLASVLFCLALYAVHRVVSKR